jgi:hypothetical protein
MEAFWKRQTAADRSGICAEVSGSPRKHAASGGGYGLDKPTVLIEIPSDQDAGTSTCIPRGGFSMGHLRQRPSGSMGVALTALVVALSGTAVAATSMGDGDKLIKPNSLSGNRLRDHSVTGQQINLSRLGKVPSAIRADNAVNAGRLAGLLPGSFVQGGGHVFSAHMVLTTSQEKQITTIPGIGELDGSYFFDGTLGENVVSLDLTGGKNETGHVVDEVTLEETDGGSSVFTSHTAAGASWTAFEFGNPSTHIIVSTSRVAVVQFAWGSGASARVVSLTFSLFSVTGGADLILQGAAS